MTKNDRKAIISFLKSQDKFWSHYSITITGYSSNTQQKIPEIYNYNKYVLRSPELMSLMHNDDEKEENEWWNRIPYDRM